MSLKITWEMSDSVSLKVAAEGLSFKGEDPRL